jgi:hypothetical protein
LVLRDFRVHEIQILAGQTVALFGDGQSDQSRRRIGQARPLLGQNCSKIPFEFLEKLQYWTSPET